MRALRDTLSRHLLLWLAGGVLGLTLCVGPLSVAAAQPAAEPRLGDMSAAVMDQATGRWVYVAAGDRERPMASTTKIMTARLVLGSDLTLQQMVTVPSLQMRWDEMDVKLAAGQRLTVDKLMQAMLVASAGDAARTLAVAVAGSEREFVARMNQEAKALDLDGTHFANPHGMDASGHHTTAKDLTRLAQLEMQDERFAAYVKLRSVSVPQQGKAKPLVEKASNSLLLANDWVYGVKTGYTDKAGSCLVAAGDYEGDRMIVTLLGAPDPRTRDRLVVALFQYASSLYTDWASPAAGTIMESLTVSYSRLDLDLALEQSLELSLPPGAEVSERRQARTTAPVPVRKGQQLGSVVYSVDGQPGGERALVATRTVPVADWRSRLRFRLSRLWESGKHALAQASGAVANAAREALDPRAVFTLGF